MKRNFGALIQNKKAKCIPQNRRSIKCKDKIQKKASQIHFKMSLISGPRLNDESTISKGYQSNEMQIPQKPETDMAKV